MDLKEAQEKVEKAVMQGDFATVKAVMTSLKEERAKLEEAAKEHKRAAERAEKEANERLVLEAKLEKLIKDVQQAIKRFKSEETFVVEEKQEHAASAQQAAAAPVFEISLEDHADESVQTVASPAAVNAATAEIFESVVPQPEAAPAAAPSQPAQPAPHEAQPSIHEISFDGIDSLLSTLDAEQPAPAQQPEPTKGDSGAEIDDIDELLKGL